ncbi:MAG: hypothetical protein LBM96_06655 [Methanobrevibacter sp.]|jgi:ssDNA-binding Zn-finger/Zn-ribbon topoisomerase 1|nr:hypothetical protein [Candidatus Methanoflexus mossambicus]
MTKNDLFKYDTKCPQCGNKIMEKNIGKAKLTICSNYIDCDYLLINELNSVVENPSQNRISKENEWYKERFEQFRQKELQRMKNEFIAQEMEKLRKKRANH